MAAVGNEQLLFKMNGLRISDYCSCNVSCTDCNGDAISPGGLAALSITHASDIADLRDTR